MPQAKVYVESERLLLRDWQEQDLATLQHMNSDTEVMRYFPSTLNPQETSKFYHRICQDIEQHGYGLFAAEHKVDKACIGFIGLNYTNFVADFTPCVEIGWRLRKGYWRQGLASEGARECLKFAFTELQLAKVYSFTSEQNQASIRVMQKIGMSLESYFAHPKLPQESPLRRHVLYSVANNRHS
ncbi:MAG: GNAT family N-acetyltransferase [Spirochaetota bacterium]